MTKSPDMRNLGASHLNHICDDAFDVRQRGLPKSNLADPMKNFNAYRAYELGWYRNKSSADLLELQEARRVLSEAWLDANCERRLAVIDSILEQRSGQPVEFSVQIDGALADGAASAPSALRMTVNQRLLFQLHLLQILCANHGLSEVRKRNESRAPDGSRQISTTQEFVVTGDVFQVRYLQGRDDAVFVTAPTKIALLDAAYDERVVSGDTSLLDLSAAESASCASVQHDHPRG